MSPRRLPRPRAGLKAERRRINANRTGFSANGIVFNSKLIRFCNNIKQQQRIPAFNMVERLQNRVGLELKTHLNLQSIWR